MDVVIRTPNWVSTSEVLKINALGCVISINFLVSAERQLPFLEFFSKTNVFSPKGKVSTYKKLVMECAVGFLIRCISSDAIF